MRKLVLGFIACVALVSAEGPSGAATVDLSTVLANSSFESAQASGCPTSWTCGGTTTPTVYTVTSTQYTAGADGLPSGIVPNGTHAVYIPTGTPPNGTGSLLQNTNVLWDLTNNTYTLNIWVGVPKIGADGTSPIVGAPGDANRVTLLHNGSDNNSVSFNLPAPAPGQWTLFSQTINFGSSAGDYNGQTIGMLIFEANSQNSQQVNLDMGPLAVPGPVVGAGLPGLVMALGGLIAWRRRRMAAA